MPPVTRSQARLHGGIEAAQLAASQAQAAAIETAAAAEAEDEDEAGAAEAAAVAAANIRRQHVGTAIRNISLFREILFSGPPSRSMLENMNRQDLSNLQGLGYQLHDDTEAHRHLGAHCDDVPYQGSIENYQACRNGPESDLTMRWCTRTADTVHQVEFNVCEVCFERTERRLNTLLSRSLEEGNMAAHCKYHSQHVHKHWNDKYEHMPCICVELASREWRCRECSLHWMRTYVIPHGVDVYEELKRLYRVKVKRGNTVKWIRKTEAPREYPSCPFPMSGNVRCARPRWQEFVDDEWEPHPNSTFQCLNCDGFMLGHTEVEPSSVDSDY